MTDQITAPVGGSDTGPVMVGKLLDIHDWWYGADARDEETTIAGSVGRLSDLLSGTSFVALECGETRLTYAPKLNFLNDPDDVILTTLFGASEEGVWFDPDPTTCFTDEAGTTPAEVGQAVALMLDKSGNDNHATQPTAAARPTLREDATGGFYLDFDGVDDRMVFAEMPNTGTATAIFGLWRTSGSGAASVLGTGGSGYLRNSGGSLIKNAGGSNPPIDTPGPFDIVDPSAFAVRFDDGFIEARRTTGGWFSASVAGNARTDFEVLGALRQSDGLLPLPMEFYGMVYRDGTMAEVDITRCLAFLNRRMSQ